MQIAIIGSGPGGMITAKKLTDNGFKVTLFEKGSFFSQKDGPQPYSVDEMDSKYTDQGVTVAFGQPNINYVEGSCLGGGSEVNAGLYHRTPINILKEWKDIHGIDYADLSILESYFKENEKLINVGFMPFSPPIASQKIADGASALGWKYDEAPRWYKYNSDEDRGIHSGTRQSMTEAVLPLINKENIKIFLNTNVKKISEKTNNKVLIEYWNEKNTKGTQEFDAVFIACGAINTPHLLKKSKLGPRHVGKNLKLHTSIKATAKFNSKVNCIGAGIPVHQVKEFVPNFSIGGSISNLPFLSAGLSDNGINPIDLAKDWHYYATYYASISKGTGRVFSIPFMSKPFVTFDVGYKGLEILAVALKKLCELLFAAGAVSIFPSIKGSSSLNSKKDILKLPTTLNKKTASLMTIHIMGSCPMGASEKSCLDLNGKVKGTKNIYVTDASMLPSSIGVNPQGTIMAFSSIVATKFCEKNKI